MIHSSSHARWLGYVLVACFSIGYTQDLANGQDNQVRFTEHSDRVSVHLGESLFTEYVFEGYEKPILYPVIGPNEIRMTRDYPMKSGTPNEAKDHPHHKSIWFGHMRVNGESFWHNGDDAGTTVCKSIEIRGHEIHTRNELVDRNGEIVATDSRVIGFGADDDVRWIDYAVSYHASHGAIEFGDNKDGQMGIRMHPALRVAGPVAVGHAINANGVREAEIWGKRAPWIDYWAEIDGHTVGIAMFDHPTNLRHPTWWHARDYGLLSANPFGVHHFHDLDFAEAGNYTLPKGASLIFKHRFLFHPGDYQEARIAERYQAWAEN